MSKQENQFKSKYGDELKVDLSVSPEPLHICPRCTSDRVTAPYIYQHGHQAIQKCSDCGNEWLIKIADADPSKAEKAMQELMQKLQQARDAEAQSRDAQQQQRDQDELQRKLDAKRDQERKEQGKKDEADGKKPGGWGASPDKHKHEEDNPNITEESLMRYFEQRIGAVLRDNQFDRRTSGHRSGKLDNRKLYKGAMKIDRVFTRKQERLNKAYNVLIVLDKSGSMGHEVYCGVDKDGNNITKSRLEMGVQFFEMLMRAFEKHKINFALIGFTSNIELHKGWDTPVSDLPKLRQNIFKGKRNTGDNNDAFALHQARDYILKTAPEGGKNLVIVISDGQPSGSRGYTGIDEKITDDQALGKGYDENSATKKWASILEQTAPVLGIGIASDSVRHYYSNTAVVNNAREFATAILGGLSKLVTRG